MIFERNEVWKENVVLQKRQLSRGIHLTPRSYEGGKKSLTTSAVK